MRMKEPSVAMIRKGRVIIKRRMALDGMPQMDMKRVIEICVAVFFLLAWIIVEPASGQSAAERCGISGFPAPELCARAGLDTIPASYLLVVDESGSMRPMWSGMRGALAEFGQAVPEGSELDVRLFAGGVRQLIPPTVSTAEKQQRWAQELGNLAPPTGAHTDLGRAAENALEKLRSAPPDQLQFLFILTDGEQDPPPGSRFPPGWNSAWETLASEAEQITAARSVQVSLIRLAPEADVTMLQRVFPDAVVTDAMTSEALRQWFEGQARESSVNKLRLLIADDLERPAAIISSSQPVESYAHRTRLQQVQITSGRRLLTTRVADRVSVAISAETRLEFAEPVVVAPGEEVSAAVAVVGHGVPPYMPPRWIQHRVMHSATHPVQIGPEEELRRIGVSPGVPRDHIRFDLAVSQGGFAGWPLFLATLAISLILVVALVIWIKWKVHRPYLPGRIVIRNRISHGSREDGEEAYKLAGKRLRSFTARHQGGEESLTLEARSRRGKTTVHVLPHVELEKRGKKVTNEEQVRSATTFSSPYGDITYFPN